MFVIVVGGGKVGYYLTKELIESGHEVALMEKDRRRADVIKDEIKYNPDSFMPHFAEVLSDDELRTLAAHVRKLCNAGGEVAAAN